MILNIPKMVTILFISGDEVKDDCQSWPEENIRQEISGTDHTRAQGQKQSRITQQRMRKLAAVALQTVLFKPLPPHLWIQGLYTNVAEKRRSLLIAQYNSHRDEAQAGWHTALNSCRPAATPWYSKVAALKKKAHFSALQKPNCKSLPNQRTDFLK